MNKVEQHIIDNWAKEFAEPSSDGFENENSELKEELEAYKNTWKKLKEMQDIEQFDTDKAWNNLYSRIEEGKEIEEPVKVKKMAFNRMIGVAASIALILGISGYLLFTQLGEVRHYNSGLSAQLIDLPDGSQVYLNAQSELTYSKTFGKSNVRNVQLKGEAFFDVEKDKQRPFIIEAQQAFVKVLGTSFNVNTLQETVEVVVKTGKVEVYNSNINLEHVILLPGDKALMNNESILKETINSESNYLSWLNRKLVFKAMPLSQVISDLKNTYHCDIVLNDTSMANLKITSTFDNDPIDEVLQSIALAFNFSIENDRKKYTLVSN